MAQLEASSPRRTSEMSKNKSKSFCQSCSVMSENDGMVTSRTEHAGYGKEMYTYTLVKEHNGTFSDFSIHMLVYNVYRWGWNPFYIFRYMYVVYTYMINMHKWVLKSIYDILCYPLESSPPFPLYPLEQPKNIVDICDAGARTRLWRSARGGQQQRQGGKR